MKAKQKKMIALFALFLVANVTVCAQSSILRDSCVYYTVKQDLNCLICLMNEPLKDSIINTQDSIIFKQDSFITKQGETIIEAQKSINDLQKRNKRNFIFGGLVGILVESIFVLILR